MLNIEKPVLTVIYSMFSISDSPIFASEVAAGPFSSLGGGVVMSRVRRSSAPGDRETCGAGQVRMQ